MGRICSKHWTIGHFERVFRRAEAAAAEGGVRKEKTNRNFVPSLQRKIVFKACGSKAEMSPAPA